MNKSVPVLLAALGLLLLGCEKKDDDALRNVNQNPQEYHNTATDPAGPRELTGPGANTGTGDD